MIKENVAVIEKQIADAAARAGRTDKIILVAVTKNHPLENVEEAAACGITDVGENRVQEAMEKIEHFHGCLKWHLIGHLQTNKAKHAVEHFDLIHSVDSEHLLKAVDKAAENLGKVQNILLQVNVAGEESKFGMEVDAFPKIIEVAKGLSHVALVADIRGGQFFDAMSQSLKELKEQGVSYEIVFLEANDRVLVRRYKEIGIAHV